MKTVQTVRLIMSLIFYILSTLSFLQVRNYEGAWKYVLFGFGFVAGIIAICASYLLVKEFKKGFPFYKPLCITSKIIWGKPGSGREYNFQLTDLPHLADLTCNGNWARFERGNDGDMYIVMATGDETTPEKYKNIMHAVRVGVGNSGGQEVPPYVKIALSDLVDAFEKWENENK